MSRRGWVLVLSVFLAPSGVVAQPVDVDAQRAGWHFRRAVTVPAGPSARPGFGAIAIPPEIGAQAQPGFQDLRLLEADGREVPYVVDRPVERAMTYRWRGRLVDTRLETKRHTQWVVDLGEARTFDGIVLDIPRSDFAKRIRVEASADAREWRVAQEDAGVFDRPWTTRIHHTMITLTRPESARYLRLTADDRGTPPVELKGLEVTASRHLVAAEWRRPVALQPIASQAGVSRYRLGLPPRFPFETLVLAADEPVFSRRVVVIEAHDAGGQREEAPLGDAVLYRLKIDDSALAGEMLSLPVQRSQRGGELIVEVHDGDSPPLRGLRGTVTGVATRLLFPVTPGTLTLYYGNDVTRAALYDLNSLRERLAIGTTFAVGGLGPEAMNPRFARTPPLPFAAPRGGPVDVSRWSRLRRFTIEGREDLYALTLAPGDVAQLDARYADLRIVDDGDRQLPYVLEPAASEARPNLKAERQQGPRGGRATSRYRLTVPGGEPETVLALPLSALELTIQEEFFSRPFRVLAPPPSGSDRERTLVSGTVARGVAQGAAPDRPIVLELPRVLERELFLEIEDGDNAPLTVRAARGVLRVPRATFKAAPGRYRVLVGNREAEPPQYDIARLRDEILSYSAVPLEAGPSEANPAFRRQTVDLVRGVPHALALWVVLGVAVVVLLALTVRLLRTNAPGPTG